MLHIQFLQPIEPTPNNDNTGATPSRNAFCLCVLMMQCMGDMLHICKQSDKSELLLFTSLFTKHQAYLPCITNQNKEDKRYGVIG